MQPITLFYRKNLVTKASAVVFVNSGASNYEYRNFEERGKHAADLFSDLFEIEHVEVYQNLPKVEIVDILNRFGQEAELFAGSKSKDETFLVGVAWVGFSQAVPRHSRAKEQGTDGSMLEPWFEYT